MRTHFSALLRFYVSGSVLVTAYIAGTDPYSQHRFAMSEDGFGGALSITLLGAISLVGIIDVFINDWMPERFSMPRTHRHRHVYFMLLAIGQVALIFALAKMGDLRPSAWRYALDATMSFVIAVIGVIDHARFERFLRKKRVAQGIPL